MEVIPYTTYQRLEALAGTGTRYEENRLASVTCCHCHFSASLSMQNGFAGHTITKVVSGVLAGRASQT
eukprot:2240171-Pleurochrysis_carterae.AAC.1